MRFDLLPPSHSPSCRRPPLFFYPMTSELLVWPWTGVLAAADDTSAGSALATHARQRPTAVATTSLVQDAGPPDHHRRNHHFLVLHFGKTLAALPAAASPATGVRSGINGGTGRALCPSRVPWPLGEEMTPSPTSTRGPLARGSWRAHGGYRRRATAQVTPHPSIHRSMVSSSSMDHAATMNWIMI
jgi:hypothetical protein